MNENIPLTKPLQINLRNIFKDKNPTLARLIPGFIYSYLNRILHIEEINAILAEHGDKKGLTFMEHAISSFNVSVTLRGEENLPASGKFVFICNHPLGGFDGMLLLTILGKKYGDVRSLSNDILMNLENLAPLFVPVNKHGAMTQEAVKTIDQAMASDMQILTFPAGLVSRRKKGIIRDLLWKKSFLTKAIQHKRDIVPIHISGRCTNRFYRLANLRKFLRIKSNIEMFYLPDETFRHKNEHFTITIGKPVSYAIFDKSRKIDDWVLALRDHVYSLAAGNTQSFEKNS
jgi:putative hemolysin